MKDNGLENSMVTGAQYEESTVTDDAEYHQRMVEAYLDELRVHPIEAKVVIGSFLVDRIQLALNNFNTDNADIEVMAELLAEAQKELIELQQRINEFQQRINRTSDDLQSFIDDLIKQNELARQAE